MIWQKDAWKTKFNISIILVERGAEMNLQTKIQLNDGFEMPLVGFGTIRVPDEAIETAIDNLVEKASQDLLATLTAKLEECKAMEGNYTSEEFAELKAIIAETGADGAKDMGKVMGVATKKLAGLAEGRLISSKVKELLG